jgi:hypothetical protein
MYTIIYILKSNARNTNLYKRLRFEFDGNLRISFKVSVASNSSLSNSKLEKNESLLVGQQSIMANYERKVEKTIMMMIDICRNVHIRITRS